MAAHDDEPEWSREMGAALRRVIKVLRKGPRKLEPARLLSAMRWYVATYEKALKMSDILRAYLVEYGEGQVEDPDELEKLVRLSVRQEGQRDYQLSEWLDRLAGMLERRLAADRDALEHFPEALERVFEGRWARSKRHERLRRWAREATSEHKRALEEEFRREIAVTEEAIAEFRRASERLAERTARRMVEKRRPHGAGE